MCTAARNTRVKYTGCTPASSASDAMDGAAGARSRSMLRSSHAGRRPRHVAGVFGGVELGQQPEHRLLDLHRRQLRRRSQRRRHRTRAPRSEREPRPRQRALVREPLGEPRRGLEVEAPRPRRAEAVGVHLVRVVEHQRPRATGLRPRAPGLLEPAVEHQAEVGTAVRVRRNPRVPRVPALRQRDLAGRLARPASFHSIGRGRARAGWIRSSPARLHLICSRMTCLAPACTALPSRWLPRSLSPTRSRAAAGSWSASTSTSPSARAERRLRFSGRARLRLERDSSSGPALSLNTRGPFLRFTRAAAAGASVRLNTTVPGDSAVRLLRIRLPRPARRGAELETSFEYEMVARVLTVARAATRSRSPRGWRTGIRRRSPRTATPRPRPPRRA